VIWKCVVGLGGREGCLRVLEYRRRPGQNEFECLCIRALHSAYVCEWIRK